MELTEIKKRIRQQWQNAGLWKRKAKRADINESFRRFCAVTHLFEDTELLWFDSPSKAIKCLRQSRQLNWTDKKNDLFKWLCTKGCIGIKSRPGINIPKKYYIGTSRFSPWSKLIRQPIMDAGKRHSCFAATIISGLYYYEIQRVAGASKSLFPVEPLLELTRSCSFWAPISGKIIIADSPAEVHLQDGLPHKNGCPAIVYRDGYSVWALHGAAVTKTIAEYRAENLYPDLILTDLPTDAKREVVRKIGIERICNDLKTRCIDRKENYELLLLDLGDRIRRPYLKMLNPSIGVYHVEGVPPSIKTVNEALRWRNKTSLKPAELT